MLREYYSIGILERSTWFKPDGSIIRDERYADGSGTGLYLYEDGRIQTIMPYVNGVAHGFVIYYKADGALEKIVEFQHGCPVGDNKALEATRLARWHL